MTHPDIGHEAGKNVFLDILNLIKFEESVLRARGRTILIFDSTIIQCNLNQDSTTLTVETEKLDGLFLLDISPNIQDSSPKPFAKSFYSPV